MMMNRIEKMVVLGMAVIMMAGTCVVPAKAEVISGLDTAEETFFSSTPGTSSDMNASDDNFFDNSNQNGASGNTGSSNIGNTENTGNSGNASNTGSADSAVTSPSTPVSNNTTTSDSNNSNVYYYYYTAPATTTTTPTQTSEKKEQSEQITLNGTSQTTTEVEKPVSLKKPQIATVVSKKRAAVVCLKRSVSGADGYQIQLCKSKSFKKNVTQLRTVLTTKTVKTNASGTFYVRVRAYKITNGKTYYSGWSTVKTVKIK